MSIKLLLLTLYTFQSPTYSDSLRQNSCKDSLSCDAAIVYSLTNLRNPTLVNTSQFISNSLVPISIALPSAHLIYGYASSDRKAVLNGFLIGTSELLQFSVMTGIKSIVQRERPFIAHKDCIIPNDTESFWSFPSGHSGGSACLATILSLRYNHWAVTTTAITYSLYTMFARMHLGVHYPTDVAAGALVGVGSGILIHSLSQHIERILTKVLPNNDDTSTVGVSPSSTPLITIQLPL